MASFTLMKTNDRDKGGTRSSGSESCKSPTRPMARVYADNACIGRTPATVSAMKVILAAMNAGAR